MSTSSGTLNATVKPEVPSSVSGCTVEPETLGSNISHVVVIVAYSSVIVMSVAGNGIVILSVVTCRRMRTVTNFFIVSLAGSDLVMAVMCVPFTFIANWLVDRWPFGRAMCPVVPYLQTVSVFLSAFTLVGLSVDRFRAIVYPLRPRSTARQVITSIVVIWLLSLLIPLPVAIFSRVDPVSGLCMEMWPHDVWQLVYTASLMALQYFIPLAILTACYSTICYVIWIKKTPGEAENARDRRLALSKRKSVKTMIAMVVVYALCWLPLHCVSVIGDIQPTIWNFEHIQLVWIACHWLAVSSCCWNPIVYYWTNDTLRSGFTYALGTWCPCVRRPAVPPTAYRRHVVYQSTLRGSDLQPVDGDVRRIPAFTRRSAPRLYYRARRLNVAKTNNVELRQLRPPTSLGYSSPSPPVARATTHSY